MPKNLELKAHIASISDAIHIARKLKAHNNGILNQRDTYYTIPKGRLKLRVTNNRSAELIFYERPNKKGSRYSNYYILPVPDIKKTQALFKVAFGLKVVVMKKRHLFLYKNARIHLDKVDGLGAFIEFEVIVQRGKRQAQELLNSLIKQFGVKKGRVVAASYSDLVLYNKSRKKKFENLHYVNLKVIRKNSCGVQTFLVY